MSSRRKSPLFIGALTLCGALAFGELFLIYERWSASRAAAVKLQQRESELAAMEHTLPPPTREVAKAVEVDLARAERARASMQVELTGRGPTAEKLRAAKVPIARTDAYFDLATYVERMRALAKKNGVVVRAEAARFGFETYANEGPEAELIEPVFRQRQIAHYLVEALLEARPAALLAVNRGPTITAAERESRAAALADLAASAADGEVIDPSALPEEQSLPEGPDYFMIEPGASARVAGFVDTEAFRLVFGGQTAALRTFLNRLASFELPVLVREVEVEPAAAEDLLEAPTEESNPEAAAAEAPPDTEASVVLSVEAAEPADTDAPAPKAPRRTPARTVTPIVEKPLSKFTVIVEYVSLVPPAPPAPAEEAPQS